MLTNSLASRFDDLKFQNRNSFRELNSVTANDFSVTKSEGLIRLEAQSTPRKHFNLTADLFMAPVSP